MNETCRECREVKELDCIVGRCMRDPYIFKFCKLDDKEHICRHHKTGKKD